MPAADRLEDLGVRQRHPLLVARLGAEVEAEGGAARELDRAVAEGADPELRPLQVDDDRDRPLGLGLDRAHRLVALRLVGVAAVREIEPEGVGAGLEQAADLLLRRARRPERGEDLRVASATHGQRSPGVGGAASRQGQRLDSPWRVRCHHAFAWRAA